MVLLLVAAAAVAGCSGTPAASSTTPPPGCDQTTPCEMILAVDDTGIVDISQGSVTRGDWYEVTVANDGEAEHTVTLSGYGGSWTIPPLEERASVVQFSHAGCFEFASGASKEKLRVYTADHLDVSQGAATEPDPCA